ncbi:MAG: hypothetical protein P1S46_10225 [bacterium]|nr:hypothetical protein [bacterium]MDT8396539.1 hypothetical protein [bacterium]
MLPKSITAGLPRTVIALGLVSFFTDLWQTLGVRAAFFLGAALAFFAAALISTVPGPGKARG